MRIKVEVDESNVRNILARWINEKFGTDLTGQELNIEVKSKQNYRSEWETSAFRVMVDVARDDA